MAAKIFHEDHEIIELEATYLSDKSQGESVSLSGPLLPGNSDLSTQVKDLESQAGNTNGTSNLKQATPIPKLQIFTLCAVRIVDPIRYA